MSARHRKFPHATARIYDEREELAGRLARLEIEAGNLKRENRFLTAQFLTEEIER